MKENVNEQIKDFTRGFQKHGMYCGIQIAEIAKTIYPKAVAIIPLYRSCIVIEQIDEDKEEGNCTIHTYADPHWLGGEIDIETLKSGAFHSVYNVQGDRQGPAIIQTKKTEHDELLNESLYDNESTYDKLNPTIVDEIKNGSYNGVFYGVKGSCARRHYQPLLNYFLYRETGKTIKQE